jgi:hypothetical protein
MLMRREVLKKCLQQGAGKMKPSQKQGSIGVELSSKIDGPYKEVFLKRLGEDEGGGDLLKVTLHTKSVDGKGGDVIKKEILQIPGLRLVDKMRSSPWSVRVEGDRELLLRVLQKPEVVLCIPE